MKHLAEREQIVLASSALEGMATFEILAQSLDTKPELHESCSIVPINVLSELTVRVDLLPFSVPQ
jgi:hypothetical protein